MRLTLLTAPPLPLAVQIALDQQLLAAVAGGTLPGYLRIYSCPDEGIVLGISQSPESTVRTETARCEGLPVLKRFSGGGTVLVGRGCLLYTVVVKTGNHLPPYAVRRAYEHVFEPLIAAFAGHGIPVLFQPPCDLAVQGRKIAGNAQAQKRGAVLVHGSLLVHEDLDRIERCLRHPPDEPVYRRGRPHRDFLCNLSEFGLDTAAVTRILQAAWADAEEPHNVDEQLIAAARCAAESFQMQH